MNYYISWNFQKKYADKIELVTLYREIEGNNSLWNKWNKEVPKYDMIYVYVAYINFPWDII